MDFNFQSARMLHDEHMEEVALIERLDSIVSKYRPDQPPAADDQSVTSLLPDLIAGITSQIDQHFAFEEEHLFPRLAENGESDIGEFLTSEHDAIRQVGRALVAAAKEAMSGGFTDESWRNFRQMAVETSERVFSHIQKEEMGLLPMVEHFLEPEEDMELSMAYMESR